MTAEPKLSPRACAAVLGVSADYIVGEIKDGRLPARERAYESGRKRYRIDAMAFAAYIEEYWPERNRRSPARSIAITP
jgi:excisionase family DNA binding protein